MLLKVQCEKCKTKYKLDDSRIQGKGAKITCPRCRHVFVVMKDTFKPDDDDGMDGDASELQDDSGSGFQAPAMGAASSGMSESTPATGSVPRPSSADHLNWKEVGLTTFKVKVAIGLVYDFSDITTLRKYISEKRVAPTDRLSFDGKVWHVIKDIPSLDEFFIDQWMALKHERLLEEQKSAPKGPTGPTIGGDRKADKGPSSVRQTVYNPNVPDVSSIKQESPQPSSAKKTAWSADASADSKGLLGQDLFDDMSHDEPAAPVMSPRRTSSGAEAPLPVGSAAIRRTDGGAAPLSATTAGAGLRDTARDRSLPVQEKPRSLSGFEVMTLLVLVVVSGYLGWRYVSEAKAQTPVADTDPQTGIPELEQLLQQHFPVASAAAGKAGGEAAPGPEEGAARDDRRKPADRPPEERATPEREAGKTAEKDPKARKDGQKGAAGKPGSAVSVSSITAEDLFQLGQESLRMKDYDGAIQSLRSAAEMKPRNDNFQYTLGYALFLAGRYPDAEGALKKSVALNPGRREAHKWLGEIYSRQGNKASAIEAYKKYLEGSPRDADAIRGKIDKLTNS